MIPLTEQALEAFSDWHYEVQQTIAQGDFVVANGTIAMTHDRPLSMPTGQTLSATGKKASYPASSTLQFKDGKVVRASIYYDQLGLMVQAGLMPGM